MKKTGPYIIMKAADFPHYQRVQRLARIMSEQDVIEIMAGRKHLHRNPVRKPKASPAYPAAGE
jgi:hypothetical protein